MPATTPYYGAVAPVFSPVDADLERYAWNDNGKGYARRCVCTIEARNGIKVRKYTTEYAHRVVARRIFGELPVELQVDHGDLNKMNCQRGNLTLVTGPVNRQKMVSRNPAGRGVSRLRHGKYMARAALRGKRVYLGLFATATLAARAAQEYRLRMGFFGAAA